MLTVVTSSAYPHVVTVHMDSFPEAPMLTQPSTARRPHRAAVLATVCAAVLAINLDTTIVNVALPSVSRELSAGTRQLQWVVDGFNLAFAGLVLAAGSLSDRFGR